MYSKEELLIATAKKKPRLQALIDNLDDLTENQINELNEALWVKQALLRFKETKGTTQKQRLAQIWANAQAAEEKAYNDRMLTYEVRKWNSGSSSIDGMVPGRESVSWVVELKDGEPFLIRTDRMFVISGEFYKLSDNDWAKVVAGSEFFQNMTLQSYFNYYNETYLNGIH